MKNLTRYRKMLILILVTVIFLSASIIAALFSTSPAESQENSNALHRIESDSPQVSQTGIWQSQISPSASGGSYLYSSGVVNDVLSLEFEGTHLEIEYVRHPSFGSFAIEIDNTIVRTVETTHEETTFGNRAVVDYLEEGSHSLRVYPVEGTIGIDAFLIEDINNDRQEAGQPEVGAWQATWYDNVTNICSASAQIDLSSEANTTSEAEIDFNWGSGIPTGSGLTGADTWGGIFTQTVVYDSPTSFSIGGVTNNGLRIYDNDTLIYEVGWDNCFESNYSTFHTFSAGSHDLQIAYYDSTGSARLTVNFTEVVLTPTSTRTTTSTHTPSPTITRTSTSTATDGPLETNTPTNTPTCINTIVEDMFVLDNTFQVRIRNNNDGPVYITNTSIAWRPWISEMYAASANVVGHSPHWTGNDTTSPTDIGYNVGNGNWNTATPSDLRFAGGGAETLWQMTFLNGPSDLPAAGYTIYDFYGSSITLSEHIDGTGQACTIVLPLTQPTVDPFTSTHTTVPECTDFTIEFESFEAGGVVVFTLLNQNPSAAQLTAININWKKLVSPMFLNRVEMGTSNYADPSNILVWEGADSTPPTVSDSSGSGEATWQYTPLVNSGQIQRLFVDFDGLPGPNALPFYGGHESDFNGTSVTFDSCMVDTSIISTLPPSQTYTRTPTITPTSNGTPTATRTRTPTPTHTPIGTPTATTLPLLAPTNLTANAISKAAITLNWQDNSPNEDSYLLERSTNGGSTWSLIQTLPANTTNYQDSGLACDTTYHYRVRGHRNSPPANSGYSNVGIATTFVCQPVRPILIAPIGNQTSTDFDYQWQSPANVTFYQVYIARGSTVILDQWFPVNHPDLSCINDICTLDVNPIYTNGAYVWYVQSYNASGQNAWSSPGYFSIQLPPPAAINKTAPANTTTLSSGNVTFTWDREPNATYYQLALNGASEWYTTTICNASTCSVSRTLANGSYTWYVQGWGPGGYGSWGLPFTFTIQIPIPGVINKIAPIGNQISPDPIFSWTHDSNADWYYLWVGNPSNTVFSQWFSASTICSGGTCFYGNQQVFIGNYVWYVYGLGAGGAGPWGSPTAFSYHMTLNSPSGTYGGTNVTFDWDAVVPYTTWYRVWAGVNGGSAVVDQWVSSTNCNGTSCSYTASGVIPDGNYIWYVQPYGPTFGNGPWSPGLTFTIENQP